MTKNLTQGEPAKLILMFTLPLIAGNIFQQLYAFVDKEGVKAVQNNSILKAGAIQEPVKLAQLLVENARKSLNGEQVPAMINNPPLLVTKDNAASVMGSAY